MKTVRHALWAGLAGLLVVALGAAGQEKDKDKPDPDPKGKVEPADPKAKTDPDPKAKPDPEPKKTEPADPKGKTEPEPKGKPEPEPERKAKVDPVPKPEPPADVPAGADEVGRGFRAYVVAEPRFPVEDIRNPLDNTADPKGKYKLGRNPVDLVTEHGLNPVIAVFARNIPKDKADPLVALVGKMDELAGAKEYKARKLGAYLVFLVLRDEYRKDPEDRDARMKEARQFAKDLAQPDRPSVTTVAVAEAAVTPEGSEQPLVPAQVTAMGVGPKDDVVIVFYHKFQVVKRWKFTADAPPGPAALDALEAEVVKLLGPRKK